MEVPTMKIEIRNLKIARSLSEETTAYTATIYVDGAKAFSASNHGTGGCDDYYSWPGYTGPKLAEVEAWLAVNVAPDGPFEADPAKRAAYDHGTACTLESFVGRFIDTHEVNTDLNRALRKLCAIGADGKFYTYNVAAKDVPATRLAKLRQVNPENTYLCAPLEPLDDATRARAVAALTGSAPVDYEEAVYERMRENRLTAADARYLLAMDARAPNPDADLCAHLLAIAEEGEARAAAYRDNMVRAA